MQISILGRLLEHPIDEEKHPKAARGDSPILYIQICIPCTKQNEYEFSDRDNNAKLF